MRRHRRVLAIIIAVAVLLAVTGCASPAAGNEDTASAPSWMDIELTDVATGEKFRIGDFKGRPVLLESFAVWCPTCTAQQREIGRLRQADGDRIVHLSLDTDPNEDVAKIEEHLERNGFDWLYAVAPVEMTQALIDDFGLKVVNAPGAPIVLVCEDQSTRLLRTGVKSADDLLMEVEQGCE